MENSVIRTDFTFRINFLHMLYSNYFIFFSNKIRIISENIHQQ